MVAIDRMVISFKEATAEDVIFIYFHVNIFMSFVSYSSHYLLKQKIADPKIWKRDATA